MNVDRAPPTPVDTLLERETAHAVADRLLGRALTGEGSVLVLEGPAGIGKSALLASLELEAGRRGALVVSSRSGELEREFPFAAVRQLFGPWLAAASRDERSVALDGAAVIALSALGMSDPRSRPPLVDASFPSLHGLYWLVANMVSLRPLVATVDDAHWTDAPTLRFLAYLAMRIHELSVLLVVAVGPEVPAGNRPLLDALTYGPATTVLPLEPLSGSGSAAVVRRALPEAGEEFCAACHRVTGGNPLLLQELVRALPPIAAATGAIELERVDPTSVARAALTRVGRLGPGAVALARAVAVFDLSASLPRVADLAELDIDDAVRLVESLSAAQILDGGRPLAFVHPIVRSAFYDELAPAVRARWHQRAARLLRDERAPAELVATHLLATDPAADPDNVRTLESAAGVALSQGAPDVAARYLRRALQEPPPEDRRPALLHRLGLAEAHAHDPSATAHLAAAVEASRDPRERAHMSVSLGDLLMIADHPEQALPVLRASLAELSDGDRELMLLVRAQLSIASGMGGHQPFSPRRLTDLRPEQLRGDTLGERAILALHAADMSLTGQPAAEAVALARRALTGDLNLGGMGPVAAPFIVAVNVLMTSDEFGEAEAHWATGLHQARAEGSLAGYINALALRPFSLLGRGALLEAQADAQEALALAGAHGVHAMWFYAFAFLLEAMVQRGKVDEVEGLLRDNPLPPELPDQIPVNLFLVRRGFASLVANHPSQALEDLLIGGERLVGAGITTPSISAWRSHAALAHRQLGEHADARRLVDEELTLARRAGTARAIGVALRTKGLLADGDDTTRLLREAVGVLAPSAARLEHAQALCELGAAIRRSGSRTAARDPLRQALQGAHDCGAEGLAERALAELQAAGARPRRHAIRGADALTPAELRICQLAARGHTNRQIAQELFITTRTVEVHLNHAFRKLEIGNRRQLAAALVETRGE
jgi:DNA-binding CsgD family transcriptional regulator